MKTKKISKIPYKGIPFVSNLFRKRIEASTQFASLNKNSVILDVGCKDGYLLKTIRNYNQSCKCYGIENDPDYLEMIETCDIQLADVKDLPFENDFFDKVFVLDVLEHIEDLDSAMKEIKRVLKTQGEIILSGPTETWFYKFCRLIYRKMVDHEEHVHTIYEIEQKIQSHGFQLVIQKSLPGFPIPELFRISLFKKHDWFWKIQCLMIKSYLGTVYVSNNFFKV